MIGKLPFRQPNDDRFLDVQFIVEATFEEKFQLWMKWNDLCDWKDDNRGGSYLVGYLDTGSDGALPVWVTCWWATINGVRILFYESTSLVSHYGWLQDFVVEASQKPTWDCTRLAHANTTNFHHAVQHIEEVSGIKMRDNGC